MSNRWKGMTRRVCLVVRCWWLNRNVDRFTRRVYRGIAWNVPPVAMVALLGLSQAFGGVVDHEATAMLVGADGHYAAGTVAIKKDAKGHSVLALSNFKISRLPDGRVYLAKDGDYTKGLELGRLEQFSGTLLEFPIPVGVDPGRYDSVVIWCHKFDVRVGDAYFENPGIMREK